MQTLATMSRPARCRARRKAGLQVLSVVCDEFAVQDFLVASRFLKPSDPEDRVAVQRALAELIDKLVKEQL